ncbi:family 43 glycosylhydrolase [Mucilaginibacter terrae]|uniref:Arabinoxylan arabinofuranohydrolase n=1 Tax=Mucilaginibacter terrae TaxID=1955052 RepID=A0ABU3GV85_9SPHI|nr:family 43 glycosylhydrolase [Mucilaginibacter terrae]MDT3403680.1 arabinoxylan arabinofuranohydrolase [Mucilaginibacter terrae]
MSQNLLCKLFCFLLPLLVQANCFAQKKQANNACSAYLFTYFTGNSKDEEAIRFALSTDGYHFRALNGNKPVISSAAISATGGVRDPHILRGADGKTFYMVATDMVSANGWDSNRGMVLLKSTDLINWKSAKVHVPTRFPAFAAVNRVWAPQTIYDAKTGKYMVYWSMRAGSDPDKIYYAYANKDFTDFESEPKQLFFKPDNGATIDGDIVSKDGKFYLFFKTEGSGSGIKIAVSDKLTEGYVLKDKYVQQTPDPVEGAGVFKLNDGKGYILMYDLYTKGKYQFTKTIDLENFKVVDSEVSMNFHPRHGTVLPITAQEQQALIGKWGKAADILQNIGSKAIKQRNIAIDTVAKTLQLQVLPGSNLSSFNPQFAAMQGVKILPSTPQNFTKGAVKYTVAISGQKPQTYTVSVKDYHNAILNGSYADPDIIFSKKMGKYYLYPTSDGFTGWSGTYFKTFSSPDLVHWKDEGVILDLAKDVSWAKKNAWAPTAIEKEVNGKFKYYFYFCAAQKIGVAVADNPAGPFTDLGKPLIDKLPEGVKGGQQIDPAVFYDPQTRKNYIYWGNGYMAVAELNDDMVSVKEGTTKIITPDKTFREGCYVIFRKGTYYFLWSEDDTRSPNYQVRYGTSTSATGPITIPANNLILSKDAAAGIYGTGHNSVIQVPGKDEWYIVYHRFTYPGGINMGDAAGYNREVCIDKLEFNADGSIKPTAPTHKGIKPLGGNK